MKARLGWRLRVRTTLHMCNGLEYLHSDSMNKPKVGELEPHVAVVEGINDKRTPIQRSLCDVVHILSPSDLWLI